MLTYYDVIDTWRAASNCDVTMTGCSRVVAMDALKNNHESE